MADLTLRRRRIRFSYGKVFVCLLLAGLFLHNPFLALCKESSSLTVCHPASYRSTVASSEVEQFAPPAQRSAALLREIYVVVPLLFALPENAIEPRRTFKQKVGTPQTGFSSSLWFRPPPAV